MEKEMVYNKLVRDKIPQIIAGSGKTPVVRTASADEARKLLHAKLVEELEEFIAAPSEEELADMLEVIEAMAHEHQLEMNRVQEKKARKQKSRGGFRDRVVLLKVIEKSAGMKEE